jgi:squalene-hopene/tetraprenyl-beta-curcumene cyclase
MNLKESISKAASYLLTFQREDGHFEGELSANTFPTCAYALIQTELYGSVDDALVEWFIRNQNPEGYWGLDASGGSDRETTLFAKLALREIGKTAQGDRIQKALEKSPDLSLNHWLVKLMYARYGHISWEEIKPPFFLSAVMRMGEFISPILPKSMLARFKPPDKYPPPVRLFYSPMFRSLFIAEKYTLVPILLIVETHTQKRKQVISELADWILEKRCIDGSWFRVGLISALSVMALMDAKSSGYENTHLDIAIKEGVEWLNKLRTADGGCREAINLNVWDTTLSVSSLHLVDAEKYNIQINQAAEWLLENQNDDGGWAFSGLPGGNLPSDADDTALSTLALSKARLDNQHITIQKGINWLRDHQSDNGGWGTYIPGVGDVSCVSITSHVIDACLEIGALDRELEKAIAWIRNSISNHGYWSDLWLSKNTYGTALAISALIKSGNAHLPEVKRGVKWLEQVQNSDGGWGEDMAGNITQSTAEQTAWSTYALLLDDISGASARRGIEYLLLHQKPDGSWDPSCVGIYWEVIGGYIDPVYPSVFALMALNKALSS